MMRLDDYLKETSTRNEPVMEPTRLGDTEKAPEPMRQINVLGFETRDVLFKVYNELCCIDTMLSGDQNQNRAEPPEVHCLQELMTQINMMSVSILGIIDKIREVL